MREPNETKNDQVHRVSRYWTSAIVQLAINIIIFIVFDNWIILAVNAYLTGETAGAFLIAFSETKDLLRNE